MKVGFALPNIGPVGTAEAVSKVAQRAEALGYDSLWTVERLLYPVKPQTPYPATPDGLLPEPYKYVLDPLEALTFAAGQTKKIALGTSVLDIPYHNPVMLARRVTTLDVLSNGRARLGLGLGLLRGMLTENWEPLFHTPRWMTLTTLVALRHDAARFRGFQIGVASEFTLLRFPSTLQSH